MFSMEGYRTMLSGTNGVVLLNTSRLPRRGTRNMIQKPSDFKTNLFIDGNYVEAAGGRLATLNPATNEILAEVAAGGAEDIDRAVQAARRAFEEGPWPRMRVAERIVSRADALGTLECLDVGKLLEECRRHDIPRSAQNFTFFGGDQPVGPGGLLRRRHLLREGVEDVEPHSFLECLIKAAGGMRVGDPTDPSTQIASISAADWLLCSYWKVLRSGDNDPAPPQR
jgi:hypothetical protein